MVAEHEVTTGQEAENRSVKNCERHGLTEAVEVIVGNRITLECLKCRREMSRKVRVNR